MVDNIKPSAKAKKRHGGLSFWLVVLMIGAGWSAVSYFGSLFVSGFGVFPTWIMITMGLISIINFILLIYIWQWKLWAFQGFVAITVIVFIINVLTGATILSALLGFLGVIILYLLMRPQWKWFE